MNSAVFKAVIPAAGFGTRMLPFTKAVPKELIPLVDTPVLQYVIEEAVAAGATEILIIISSGKEAVKHHFESAPELEKRLAYSKKDELLARMKWLDHPAKLSFVYQHELDGLGGAMKLASDFAGGDPCMVLLGDCVMDSLSNEPVIAQLIRVYEKYSASVVALAQVPPEKISSYGIAAGSAVADDILKLYDLVEKPSLADAPSNLAVAARYIFTPGIFNALQKISRGVNNELQLTDAIKLLMASEEVYGCRICGKRYDLGTPAGFVAANVEFALRRPELQDALGRQIINILKEKNFL